MIKKISKKINRVSFIRFGIKDQTSFIKRLSFLVKAGIPVLESLMMIREQTRKRGHGKIFDLIIADVSNGQALSTSMSKFRNMFGEFAINIIGFGETSGILPENLEYLAEELRKRQALRKKIIGASIYPAIVTLATIGITGFLMVYLFPKIMPVFSSINMELPWSTKTLIFLSDFIRHYGLITLVGIVIVVIAFIVILRTVEIVHFYFDKVMLRLPIVGKVMQDYNLANSTRTMGLLLKSGITVSDALPITAKTTRNLVYKNEFNKLAEIVNRGEKISVYFKKDRILFPDVLTQVVSVGERGGDLSGSLVYLSEMYEAEVEDFTKNISGLVEPILMIFMGIMVGFVAISIITPIYSITQNLSPK